MFGAYGFGQGYFAGWPRVVSLIVLVPVTPDLWIVMRADVEVIEMREDVSQIQMRADLADWEISG